MKNKKTSDLENKVQATDLPADGMEELDDGDLTQVSGAGNPLNRPRMNFQKIDDDLRKNG